MPLGLPSFAEAVRAGAEIFHTLRGILKKKGYSTGVGDEGGFAPSLKSNREALDVVMEAVTQAGYKPGDERLPRARRRLERAVERRRRSTTSSRSRASKTRSADEMVALYDDWVTQYPIISIEDGLAEGDWDGWKTLTKALGDRGAARRRRRVRDQPGDPEARHRGAHRQRAARQAESDRHRHRNARRRRDGRRRRLSQRHLAPVRRNRRHDHRRSRGRRPAPARSRPARPAAPIASRSTTSCCASRRSSAAARGTRERQRSSSSGKRLKLSAHSSQPSCAPNTRCHTSPRPHRPRRLGTPRREREQRDRARANARVRRLVAALPACAAHHVGRGCRTARPGRWATPRSAT